MDDMNQVLDILIPTYNRSEFLSKNISGLIKQIEKSASYELVTIYISDNCSTDNTELTVRDLIKTNTEVNIKYHKQNSNIGLEPNVVNLMGKATSPYVMWIGDDDFIDDNYLSYCLDQIKYNTIGCIIPGLKNLYEDGSIVDSRNEPFETKKYKSGYDAMWSISHLSHQMSGILLARHLLLYRYLDKPSFRNPYLFIFWTADCLFRLGGIYAPKYKTGITTYNTKDWGYNDVGLLDEVFKSYYYFEKELTTSQFRELLLRFSRMHSYRYNIKWNAPITLIRKYFTLVGKVPEISGFKKKLVLQLVKDYLISWKILLVLLKVLKK